MSVEIFNIIDGDECSNICIPVASENNFNSIWVPALQQLDIKRIGNGVWLQRDDLELILFDFCRVKNWAEEHLDITTANYVISHINFILEQLPYQWEKNPHITKLWMG